MSQLPISGLFSLSAGLVLCVTIACARPKTERLNAAPNVITEEDIARVRVRTAYDAVIRIHANFLTRRGETSLLGTSNPEPNVYLDDVFIGTVAQLKGIQASDVASIRLYRAGEATTRFGGGNMGGVIEVYTKHYQVAIFALPDGLRRRNGFRSDRDATDYLSPANRIHSSLPLVGGYHEIRHG